MKNLLKGIYALIPFKKHIFLLLRAVWKPRESLYRHLHFKGIFNVKVGSHGSFRIKHYGYQIENEIFWAGLEQGWEKVSFGLWVKLCSKANVIVDVGSNTGVFSLIAKTVAPRAEVYAFEPVDRVFQKLEHNNRLNNFDIRSFKLALSNYNGNAVIYDTDTEHVYSVTVNKNLYSPNREVKKTEIPVITFQSFIEQHKLQRVDIMKIDVETHEPEVLEGFGVYLEKFRPAMLIEILDDEVGEKVEGIVAGLDYLYFNIDERAGVRKVDRIVKSDFHNYLLCNKTTAAELGLIK